MPSHVSIQYTEGDPATYSGVSLLMQIGARRELFNTGDPTTDYLTALMLVQFRLGPDPMVLNSSSVDHFAMDGGELEDADPPPAKIELAARTARDYMLGRGETPHSFFLEEETG